MNILSFAQFVGLFCPVVCTASSLALCVIYIFLIACKLLTVAPCLSSSRLQLFSPLLTDSVGPRNKLVDCGIVDRIAIIRLVFEITDTRMILSQKTCAQVSNRGPRV